MGKHKTVNDQQVDMSQAVVTSVSSTKMRVGGVSPVPARPTVRSPIGGAFPASGSNPDFKYNGGPIIVCPQVFVSYWGASWSDATHQPMQQRINQFYIDLLNSNYMNMLSQYGTGMGARNGGAFVGSGVLTGITGDINGATIHGTIQSCIDAGAFPEPGPTTDNILMIHLDEG